MQYARRMGSLFLIVAVGVICSLFVNPNASAAGTGVPWIADSTKAHLIKYSYQQVLANCFGQVAEYPGTFTESDINNPSKWFTNSKTTAASYIAEPVDGVWSCNSEVGQGSRMTDILTTFGWTGNLAGINAACDLGAIRVSDSDATVGWQGSLTQPKPCTEHFADNSWGYRIFPSTKFPRIRMGSVSQDKYTDLTKVNSAQVKTVIGQKSGLTHIGNNDRYILDWAAFAGACQPTNGTLMADKTFTTPLDPNTVHLSSGNATANVIIVNQDSKLSYMVFDYTNKSKIYAFPIEENEDNDIDHGSARIFTSCQDLVSDMNSASGDYSILVSKQQGQPGSTTVAANPEASASKSTTTCAVDGIGWIICPVMNFLGGLADGARDQINGFLEVKSASLFDTTKDTYIYWGRVKNIANILFIIGFLVIIYSQITGAGISNYGLKKMLPKLIIVAVLVNISFWVCALAVDLSNILGYSVGNFLGGLTLSGNGSLASGFEQTGNAFTGIVVTVLAGGAAMYFALGALAAALVGVLFAAVSVLFILTIRSALIILLIVLSPLAMAALLLPNTEGLFKKWMSLLKNMLLIFPIISVLYGGGKLAAGVLKTQDPPILMQVLIAAIPFLMLYASYILLKKLLDGVAGAGALLSGLGKIRGAAEGKAKSGAENSVLGRGITAARGYRQQNRLQKRDNFIASRSPLRRVAGFIGGKGYAQTLEDRAAATEAKDHNEAVERATSRFSGMTNDQILAQAKDTKATAAQRQAAVMHLLQKGTHDEKKAAVEASFGIDGSTPEGKRARAAIGDEYAKSDLSSLYGKGIAGKIKAGESTVDLQSELRENYGKITAQTLASNPNYAKDVSESFAGADDKQKEAIQETIAQIAANPTLTPAAETQGHLNGIPKDTRVRDINQAHDEALVQDALYNMNNPKGP